MRDQNEKKDSNHSMCCCHCHPGSGRSASIQMSQNISALEIDLGDEGYSISRSVVIDGYYHVNYFRKNTFTGKISIDGYSVTDSDLVSLVEIAGDNNDILYNGPGTDRRLYFGRLFSNHSVSELVIALSDAATSGDPSGGGVTISENSGRYIVTDSATRDSAVEKICEIIRKYIY